MDLAWSAPAQSSLTLLGYDVFQGTSPGGESSVPVNTSPVTGTSDTVTGLAAATTYYFTVTAVYPGGQSTLSNEASAATKSPGSVGAGGPPANTPGPAASPAASAGRTLPASASPRISGSTVRHGRAVAHRAAPRTLIVIPLAAVIIALLAAGGIIARRLPHSRPPMSLEASVRAEAHVRPPAAVRVRVTGTGAAHAVRIESHACARNTMIKEVRS